MTLRLKLIIWVQLLVAIASGVVIGLSYAGVLVLDRLMLLVIAVVNITGVIDIVVVSLIDRHLEKKAQVPPLLEEERTR